MTAYIITATATDRNGVTIGATQPETLGDAYRVQYQFRDEAQSVADELAANLPAGYESVRYAVDEVEVTYSEYTVCVGNDASNYGSVCVGNDEFCHSWDCTRDRAVKIADSIQTMIETQFPGINVRRTEEIGAPTPTTGPDSAVIDEINLWIQTNWTAAL